MNKYQVKGRLQYGPGIRVVVWIDKEIGRYYRSLVPKSIFIQPQMYPSHVTVVRTAIEIPSKMEAWGKYENEEILIDYSNEVHFDDPYFYLNAWSERIGEIREELGLSQYRMLHPSGYKDCYHITIGNTKLKETQ